MTTSFWMLRAQRPQHFLSASRRASINVSAVVLPAEATCRTRASVTPLHRQTYILALLRPAGRHVIAVRSHFAVFRVEAAREQLPEQLGPRVQVGVVRDQQFQ